MESKLSSYAEEEVEKLDLSPKPSPNRVSELSKAKRQLSPLASVRLSVTLMSLMALTVLLGAWCPQESQVGQEKVFQAFDRHLAEWLIRLGVSDIFHSPWFLFLTALISINMVVVSFQRVFPKLKTLNKAMPYLGAEAISHLTWHRQISLKSDGQKAAVLGFLALKLSKLGYKVEMEGDRLKAQYGKFGRLAPSATHVGLLSLLLGVTITSWTGFSGFTPVGLRESLDFTQASHAKLWLGKIPQWKVRVEKTSRENYPTGEAKQWYSTLSVINDQGQVLKSGEISVNNPLSYDGVDIYQSSWGLEKVAVAFNGHRREFDLNSMGAKYAAFVPLDKETVLVMSLGSDGKELRLFAKRPNWPAPKLLAQIPAGKSVMLGEVELTYLEALPVTGLQYKCDPGLPVTYVAFCIITIGVFLAAIPHRHVWAIVAGDENDRGSVLSLGGSSRKAKVGFVRSLDSVVASVSAQFKIESPREGQDV
jgi:cytochrome c biogenesis protein